MVKQIIFDFDGTLVDSTEVLMSVFNELADKYKFNKITNADIETLRRMSNLERSRYVNFPLYKVPFIVAEFNLLYSQKIKNVNFFEGIKDVLDELNSLGYKITIISSNSEKNIRDFLNNNNVTIIDEVISSNNLFGKDKVIKKYLKNHSLNKSDVIYVGDEQRDVVACKRTGIKVIWVEWGYDSKEVVLEKEPDYVVSTPEQLLNFFKT
ncbi:HAD-IA family hydrolase [Natranaerofaba carboxydovora]|uniref:HAD-IA family hydrolase n=1 Tax=Natranaerofaba carboxydovora TaxID=2742683 RepID=UPI001F131A9F|nr:HAD-IA family hydrolase [Natranaerofaba carboxydovora]UMZ74281.1 Pyrophosphatase PpaX [Natranaerofaba carboxydovora]